MKKKIKILCLTLFRCDLQFLIENRKIILVWNVREMFDTIPS